MLILFSLISNNLEILNYFLVLIIITLSLDILAFYKLSHAIKISNHSLELSQFPIYFGIVIFGKLVTLIGLKFTSLNSVVIMGKLKLLSKFQFTSFFEFILITCPT